MFCKKGKVLKKHDVFFKNIFLIIMFRAGLQEKQNKADFNAFFSETTSKMWKEKTFKHSMIVNFIICQ